MTHREEALSFSARGKAAVGLLGVQRGGMEESYHASSRAADYGYTSAGKAFRFPIQLVSPTPVCIN